MKTTPCLASLRRCQETSWNDYAVVASDTGGFVLNGQRVSLLSVNLYQGEIADIRWPIAATLTMAPADDFAARTLGLSFYQSDAQILNNTGSTSFVGHDAVAVYRATVIASGLSFYAKTGMKVNRAYTPSAMLRAATEITGMRYKRGEYLRAAQELRAWAAERAATLHRTQEDA